ncbi:MAG: hypothetical protein JWN73_3268 [Betaproteobacteria bacterium]|nr:hypothetical protein [Betaproteobacteria bacterium]
MRSRALSNSAGGAAFLHPRSVFDGRTPAPDPGYNIPFSDTTIHKYYFMLCNKACNFSDR